MGRPGLPTEMFIWVGYVLSISRVLDPRFYITRFKPEIV